MEIEMKLGDSGGWYNSVTAERLCVCSLRKEVYLPKGQNIIYAVFTKKRASSSFAIRSTYKKGKAIAGVNDYILHNTRDSLAKALKQGFRYVRIEYDG